MAKNKKVSVNALTKIMKETYANEEIVNWNGIEVTVTRTLSLRDMMEFVNNVVKSCFDVGTGEYHPEVKDFAIRSEVLTKYANFTMPQNLELQYELAMKSGAVEMLVDAEYGYINRAQYQEILNAIDDRLDNMAEANVHMLHSQFNKVVTAMEEMQNKMGSLFGGIEAGDIAKLVEGIQNSTVTNDGIVRAYAKFKDEEVSGK